MVPTINPTQSSISMDRDARILDSSIKPFICVGALSDVCNLQSCVKREYASR